MIITTREQIEGTNIKETLGIVTGSTTRCRHIGSDFIAGLQNLVGGESVGYTDLLESLHQEALERLEVNAAKINADAVLTLRISISPITAGMIQIMAYGTAVKVQK